MEGLKYGHPTVFRQPVWVKLKSDEDVSFLLQPLSYSQVYGINEYYYSVEKTDYIQQYEQFDLLYNAVLNVRGVVGFTDTKSVFKMLSITDKQYLEYKLFELSALTVQQVNNLSELIDLMVEPALQEDTYECEKCQKIPGLQLARNCPLLTVEQRAELKANFKLRVKDKRYTECPISSMDRYVVNQIIQSYNYSSLNTLPIEGGIGNQSVWFVTVLQQYKRRLNELRAEASS